MPEPLGDDAKRKIIEEEGMSEDSFRKKIDDIAQRELDRANFRNFSSMMFKTAATTEEATAMRIQAVRVSSAQLLSLRCNC